MIAFCDIDHTIVDSSHRQHFVEKDPKDWESFYQPNLMALDTPIPSAVRAVPEIISKVRWDRFFFLTGRPERTRLVTSQTIQAHFGFQTRPPGVGGIGCPMLLMRKDGDHRPARVYKQEMIERWIPSITTPVLFFDDDLRNEYMYKSYGIFFHAPSCFEVIR